MSCSTAYAATTTGNSTTGAANFAVTASGGYNCASCHLALSTYPSLANAANAGNVASYVNATHLMGNAGATGTVANDIAAYIATLVTGTATSIAPAYNTAATGVVTNVYTTTPSPTYLYTDLIDTIETVSAPAKGSVSFVGAAPATITYTPTNGACGADSFTYQGRASTGTMGTTSLRSVSVTIGNPPKPTVNAGQSSTSGVYNTPATQFTLTQTSTQSAALCGVTRFSATTVAYGGAYTTSTAAYPPGLTLNTTTGAISGTPTAANSGTPYASVPVCAINPGGATCTTVSITPGATALTVMLRGATSTAKAFVNALIAPLLAA